MFIHASAGGHEDKSGDICRSCDYVQSTYGITYVNELYTYPVRNLVTRTNLEI